MLSSSMARQTFYMFKLNMTDLFIFAVIFEGAYFIWLNYC